MRRQQTIRTRSLVAAAVTAFSLGAGRIAMQAQRAEVADAALPVEAGKAVVSANVSGSVQLTQVMR